MSEGQWPRSAILSWSILKDKQVARSWELRSTAVERLDIVIWFCYLVPYPAVFRILTSGSVLKDYSWWAVGII